MGNQEIIKSYIKRYIGNKQDPNSAIMIKGAWGCGKTYFVKNAFNDDEMKNFLQEQDKRSYYISLNGISSNIEIMKRIQTVIINEKMGFYKHKSKSEAGMMEIVTGVDTLIDDIKIQGWLNLAIGAKKKIKKMVSDKSMDSAVFIFDDLERCTMSLKEVFGMINDLIEHKKCKCIIIANEEEIAEKNEYYKMKEKFISRTLEFVPDLDMFLKTVRNDYTYIKQINVDCREAFINEDSHSFDVNLRIIQSAFFIVNEVFCICKRVIKEENQNLIQKVLKKLLIDIYTVEKYCKEGNEKLKSNHDGFIINDYNLGPGGNKKIFTFVFDIVYDGNYNEETISKHIETYMQYLKTEDKYSPIASLEKYECMEDDDIQENLNRISSSVKKINLKQASDMFNFLIPLLDLGFHYNDCTDFDEVLEKLKDIEISVGESDFSYEVFGIHTNLKGDQFAKYVKAIDFVEEMIEERKMNSLENKNNLLYDENWLDQLSKDLEDNKDLYRKNQKYLSCFDINIILNKLEKSTNQELFRFKNLLNSIYNTNECNDQFHRDKEIIQDFFNKLGSLVISTKINRLTINRIMDDLQASFLDV